MSTYITNESITIENYRDAMHPATLIAEVEQRVRRTLEGAPHAEGEAVPTGDVEVGWLAVVGGRYRAWTPGEELPEGTDGLSCRGRRIA